MTDTDELKQELATTRQRLMAAIAGVSEQQFKKRPAATAEEPEPWCIAELLAHLLIDERLWTQRIDQALTEEEPAITPSNRVETQARIRDGRQAPVPQLIHGLLAARRDLERVLDVADSIETGFERKVRHSERGELNVEWMVRKVTDHEQEHIGQIERLREAVGATTSPPATASPLSVHGEGGRGWKV